MKSFFFVTTLLISLVFSLPLYAAQPVAKLETLRVKLSRELNHHNYHGALKTIEEITWIEPKLSTFLEYIEAQALWRIGENNAAADKLKHYIEVEGENDQFYNEAVSSLNKILAEDTKKSYWEKSFALGENNRATSINKTDDDGYAITGTSSDPDRWPAESWAIKLDANGNKDWTFSEEDYFVLNDIVQVPYDGYFAVGMKTYTTDEFGSSGWLVKLDSEGQKEWAKKIVEDSGALKSIISVNSNNFVACGYDNFPHEGLLVKFDSTGKVLWEKHYEDEYCMLNSVIKTEDGGYLLVGWDGPLSFDTVNTRNMRADARVIKTDADGNQLWSKTFGGSSYDSANSVVATYDDSFIIVGETCTNGTNNSDFWFFKLDQNGEVIWEKTYGEKDDSLYSQMRSAKTIIPTKDGSFTFIGVDKQMDSPDDGYTIDFSYIFKITNAGELVWKNVIESSIVVNDIVEVKDRGLIVVGTDSVNNDFMIIKLDKDGKFADIK